MKSALEDLARPIEDYYASFRAVKARNFPSHLLDKMAEHLLREYEEDLLAVYEGLVDLMFGRWDLAEVGAVSDRLGELREDLELFVSLLENNTTIGQFRDMVLESLGRLIDGLRENEERFYREVFESGDQDFHITSYYSLYLMFLVRLYVKLREVKVDDPNVKTRDSELKSKFAAASLMAMLFAVPILVYVKRGERFPYLSEMAGLLLHALTSGKTPIPSPGSWLRLPGGQERQEGA